MSTPHPARVFLVDDHPLVREWLANLIERQDDLTVCGEAGSAAAALAGIGAARADVVIVDITLDGRSGLELIKDLRQQYPAVPVLVLSMHDESLYAERAMRAGARGYIMKREVTKQVIVAIRRVLQGQIYLSERMTASFAERLVGGAPSASESTVSRLSDRELEVFRMLGHGMPTREIAVTMHVSAKTVQAYCARIKEKLGLAGITELLREAIRWVETQGAR
jgi:DNA-binding NarL/FixJ family response regulator